MLGVRCCGGMYTHINRVLPFQKLPLDSLGLDSMLNMEQEEEPPFPEAQRILKWEQRIVSERDCTTMLSIKPLAFPVSVINS